MKKLLSAISIIIILFTLSGCENTSADKPIKSSKTELRLTSELSSQGYIYYSDGNSVRRVKSDGSGDEPFTDFYSTFLFVADDWVYYTDNENHPEYPDHYMSAPVIHRRSEDGSIDECISRLPAMKVTYEAGYIYYMPYYSTSQYDYGSGLYRINPDGSGEIQLFDDKFNDYYFDDEYIYMHITSGDIVRMDMNCENPKEVIDAVDYSAFGISDVVFTDEYIYYTADLFDDYLDNLYLYRIKKDGSEKIQLTDMSTKDFIVSGDYIYFVGSDSTISDRYLYKMTVDGKNKIRIGKNRISYDNDYLQYDGTYIYAYFIDGKDYTESFGVYETSSLYKIECDT